MAQHTQLPAKADCVQACMLSVACTTSTMTGRLVRHMRAGMQHRCSMAAIVDQAVCCSTWRLCTRGCCNSAAEFSAWEPASMSCRGMPRSLPMLQQHMRACQQRVMQFNGCRTSTDRWATAHCCPAAQAGFAHHAAWALRRCSDHITCV